MIFRTIPNSPLCRVLVLAVACLAVIPSRHAYGQIAPEQVTDWLSQEWKESARGLMPFNTRMRFIHRALEVPPESELTALRDAVSGRPDHPQRTDLEAYERRIAGGGDTTVYTIAYGGPGRWRVSRSIEYDDQLPYWDTAAHDGIAWGLTAAQLTVVEADAEGRVNRNYVDRGLETIASAWTRFAFGNFAFGWFSESEPELVEFDGERWVARAVNRAGVIGEWRGRWDESLGRGFVESVEFVGRTDGEPTSGSEWVFGDWRYWEQTDAWLATRVERTSQSRPHSSYSLLEVAPVSDRELSELCALPDLAG